MLKTSLILLLLASAASSTATTLVIDAGWQDDQVGIANTNSSLSPWIFTLTSDAVFRVTDAFKAGDVYHVTDIGNAIDAFTTFTTDGAQVPDYAGVAWTDTTFSRLSLTLAAGTYSLGISGNCAGGCPAGFGVRLDSAVPEPASWGMLIVGFSLVGTALRRRSITVAA
jgi:hypothetical protein